MPDLQEWGKLREVNGALLALPPLAEYCEYEVNGMNCERTGQLIASLRQEQGLTQSRVAEQLHVSAQAVSKWERGLGCPDVSLLIPLAEIFGVPADRLLTGTLDVNETEVGNMRKLKFYVCPACGNLLTATGPAEPHCCGRKLEPLTAAETDEDHRVTVEEVEDEWYVTVRHPMDKDHFLRFAACVGSERVLLVRLYPEQDSAFRIPQMRGSRLYLCCSRHGLFEEKL